MAEDIELNCIWCGDFYHISPEILELNNLRSKLCSYCYDEVGECDSCGGMDHKYTLYNVKTSDGVKRYCRPCIDPDWIMCDQCRLFMPPTNIKNSYPVRRNENNHLIFNSICLDCNTKLEKCDICKEKYPSSLLNRHMCPSCYEQRKTWHDFNYKPIKLIYHTSGKEGKPKPDTFFMGFELEIVDKYHIINPRSLGNNLFDRYGYEHLYVMRDGTIERSTGKSGAEIVTYPFTWYKYKEDILVWDDILLYLRNIGYSGHYPGIGIHIHTSKTAWGTYQLFKLVNFAYNNPKFIEHIAQRPANYYCSFPEDDYKHKPNAIHIAKDKRNKDPNHYHTINLNNTNGTGSNTVEFRMFQSTLEPLYFHKNIEFVHACWQITQEASKVTEEVFRYYIDYNKYMYPCLYEFLTKEI